MVPSAPLPLLLIWLLVSPAPPAPEGDLLIEGRPYRVVSDASLGGPRQQPLPLPWANGAKVDSDNRGFLYVRGKVRRRLAVPVDALCVIRAPGPEGDLLCRVWNGGGTTGQIERTPAPLFRVTPRGQVRRLTYPVSDRGSLDVVCGGRYWVATLESLGTVIYDLATDAVVADVPRVGAFHNTRSWGPACSPDGRLVAVATPYGDEVTVLRLSDGGVVAKIVCDAPGGVTWREGDDPALVIHHTFLPFE